MKLSQQSQSIIETAIQKAIGKYTCGCEQTIITDFHLQPNSSGQFIIYNDEDQELANVMIEEWADYEGDNLTEEAENSLRSAINKIKESGELDKLSILKPYSFVLIDEERETICDLMLIDDDTLLLSDELLKGLDQELDDFLKDLLEK
ncbi:MAG: hypothetical protein ACK5ND_01265 [Bacteroides sp.]